MTIMKEESRDCLQWQRATFTLQNAIDNFLRFKYHFLTAHGLLNNLDKNFIHPTLHFWSPIGWHLISLLTSGSAHSLRATPWFQSSSILFVSNKQQVLTCFFIYRTKMVHTLVPLLFVIEICQCLCIKTKPLQYSDCVECGERTCACLL